MKLARFVYEGVVYCGQVRDSEVFPLGKSEFSLVKDVWEKWENVIRPISLSKVKLLPPVQPSKIVCVGRNYVAHALELGNLVPEEPLIFLKPPSSLIGHEDFILLPPQSSRVECEGELAIVIRRECQFPPLDSDVSDYILGYTCLNDVTARDIQKKDIQFTRAKSFDTFCPLGPFIATDINPSNLCITTKVNGNIKQQARTSQMVFSVDFLVRYISHHMTLMPGDVIATGTPAGVSELHDGDVCEVEIEGIGVLRNFVKKRIKGL